MILSLYRVVTTVGAPLIGLYLARRKASGKEDPERFGERLGIAGVPRPSGPVLWIHAASVGESLSVLTLIERIVSARPNLCILMTTGTLTSARLMVERLPAGVHHQFVPVDRLPYVRRFLDHWRPDLALWMESEFWPNLITEAASRNIPQILVNGRISPRSFQGWQRFPSLIRQLLCHFTLCLGQTEEDAGRLKHLGAPAAKCVGNLKFAAPPLPVESKLLSEMQDELAGRPRWLAASTHLGEEEAVCRAHETIRLAHPGLLTIIVPRHPGRGSEIASRLTEVGAKVARRAADEAIGPDTDVYIADTMGELGLFFRLCTVAFMGKSLVPLGGQNLLEPARLGCAILHGPHMANFAEIAERMTAAGASQMVADEKALAEAAGRLLADDGARTALVENASKFAVAEAGVLDAVYSELSEFLDAISVTEGNHAST
jgi:3-deoxy-D-manno-octulosonic-acid transferase